MLQFKIPQNVQREDKIVGPLTLKQLIICMVGGGIAYVLYITLAKEYFMEIWLPPVIVIVILTLAVAFAKINDIPFAKWILLQIEFFIKPRKRVWTQGAGDVFISAYKVTKPTEEDKKRKKKKEEIKPTINQINELTKILDTHGMEKGE